MIFIRIGLRLDGVEVVEGLDTGGGGGVIGTTEPDILEVVEGLDTGGGGGVTGLTEPNVLEALPGFWSVLLGGEAIGEVPLADRRCY